MESVANDIKDMMNAWDLSRYIWIKKFGSDEGFQEWFTRQVGLNSVEVKS